MSPLYLYLPDVDPQAMFLEHGRWGEIHARPAGPPSFRDHDRQPDRRLRVGYVSADLRRHPVAVFLEGLFAATDPAQVEIYCYADVLHEDDITARLRRHVAAWRDIAGTSDEHVASLIREDRIDILVDLAGHPARHRLRVFARKPAPLQVTLLEYPDTTGVRAIDYRITDRHADPPGRTEPLHTEHLVHLPDCAWCFRPEGEAPPVSAAPVVRAGYVTFGCFNAHQKLSEPLLELWARIMHRVPDARLLLKHRLCADPGAQQHFRSLLIARRAVPRQSRRGEPAHQCGTT
jgi:predicted O-linked N-acetylglucosamine transferase (SPINDLY family)